ncbi:DUF6504 family protein [Brevibacterium sp. XM4083]|uniref:DUF6504 family protein n=1 Tax=Brevibacterium sp. XM4083 TaxID=2583238 RepID=UPI001128B3F1|nr:DUF6504 family protein [Brevibacterium sp. XM4083]MCM1011823.1 DUF6504 family protein [Brevibacterium sp. XM4083]
MDTMHREEVATVWTTISGAPERFIWHRRRFVVCARPIPWMARVRWWKDNTDLVGARNARMVERPMWQVQAKALDDGEMLIFDLAVADGPHWSIRVVSD